MASCILSARGGMSEVVQVREWDADAFHQKVAQLEAQGFVSRLESYRIVPEMDPDTGAVIHLYTIEMYRPE